MKILLVLVVLLISEGSSFGQETGNIQSSEFKLESPNYVPNGKVIIPKPKSLYFELGGSGGFGSFNFELTFKQQENFRWMFRTGISGTYIDKNHGVGCIFPVMVHCVYGQKHGLDMGIGQALTITTRGGVFLRSPLSIGYRFEPKSSRLFYRFSYTPIISYLVNFQWEHWGGISVGYRFLTIPKLKKNR
jgi:hypothetical protein